MKEEAMQKVAVSVVVLTKNEEANIAQCLDSVRWADEIIVVDDLSTDKTVEIVKRYTNKLFVKKMDVEGRHRNWAYAQARNAWVLSLDADELVSEELRKEITGVVNSNSYVAYAIPLRNYIRNYWVRYGGWYPASKVRLFQKDKFKYEEVEVHPRIIVQGKCSKLHSDIIHNGYPDIEHFLASVNRQSTLEAVKWINTGRRMSLGHALWRSFDRFCRRFIRKKGFRDGLYGFTVAFFDSLYQILSYIKFRELKSSQKEKER